jgi:hypothetical protein
MKNYMINILILSTSIALAACSGHNTVKSEESKIIDIDTSQTNNTIGTGNESITNTDNELTNIYSKAISDFIEAIYQKDKTTFDTLFFNKRKNGQPDDFPDIELPKIINGTKLLLLSPEETNNNKQLYRKSSPYINLIGWVETDKAEFTFVTFYPEFQHRYDYYVSYQYNATKDNFVIEKARIEDLILDNTGKADHFAIYEDGKYIGDKPIN